VFDKNTILLVLTTIVSLEAIYLSIFIQMSVNLHSKKLQSVASEVEELQKGVEDIQDDDLKASVVCSFEVFEHLFDPDNFILSMKKLLKPGGILLFTTLTISGFDLLMLAEHSKSISPPHHINFLSLEGIRALIKRCGLTEILIETPGKLDVDIVKNMYDEIPDLKLPDFVEYLIKNRDAATHKEFQDFLQKNNLSSHIRVIARNDK
jgi:SAM-dependent methyltransferase